MAREMKDSGVEWIGKIPREWYCHSLKVIIIQNDGGIWGDDPIGDDGDIVLRSTEQTIDGKWDIVSPAKRDLSKISNKICYLCKKNDLLITKSSGSNLHIGKTTIVDDIIEEMQCYYSNFIQRIRLSQAVSAKYYWYILNSDIARSQFTYIQHTTSGIGNINAKHIANLIVPKPSVQEQYCIEKYLNVKCAEIDNVLEKTRASIEEYKKLKQAVITQAVTKGIRGDREMKDSRIDWIGEIPVEWEERRIKTLFTLRDEKNFLPLEDVNLISLYTDLGVVQHSELEKTTGNKASNADGYKKVYKDDIVVNIILCWVGAIGRSEYNGVTSPAYDIYIPQNEVLSKFYHYYFRTKGFSGDCYKRGKGIMAMRWRTYSDQFRDISVVYPLLEEQQEIVNYLDQKCSAIDELIAKKEQYLSEIENYKKSLIYECVTGKKEVPQKYQS